MIKYLRSTNDILPLFSYLGSQYMIKSLLFRKKGQIDVVENCAMITWGPSLIIGGEFTEMMCETLKIILQNSSGNHYIYCPSGKWESFIRDTKSISEKQINLYHHSEKCTINNQTEHIFQITESWLQLGLHNAQLVKDEMYSYNTTEDFIKNGFGLALVIDGLVCGYCLSEYSIDNECAINIWVDEKFRKLGYAKAMTALFLQHGKSKNWNVFWACDSDNLPSNRVAKSSGFSIHSKQNYFEWKKQ